MKNKWFDINKKEKTFSSKKRAKNLKEAFDKSLHKWSLIEDRLKYDSVIETCGFCNLYINNCYYGYNNEECPLSEQQFGKKHDGDSCVPFGYNNPDLQILYMLFVREAIK